MDATKIKPIGKWILVEVLTDEVGNNVSSTLDLIRPVFAQYPKFTCKVLRIAEKLNVDLKAGDKIMISNLAGLELFHEDETKSRFRLITQYDVLGIIQ